MFVDIIHRKDVDVKAMRAKIQNEVYFGLIGL